MEGSHQVLDTESPDSSISTHDEGNKVLDTESSDTSISIHDEGNKINIVLLSGKGFGKSSFINAFGNYLAHTSFEEAEKQRLLELFPQKFTVTDKNYKDHEIAVGLYNEQSVLKEVRTVILPVPAKNVKLHVINIPSFEQCTGQDKSYCDSVLTAVRQLKHLHAICFVFSAINTAIKDFIDCSFKEILPRLGKEICNNLIFVFTNCHAAHYKPGKTLAALKKLIHQNEIYNIFGEIPLSNVNIFSFENDSLYYLASLRQNIEFDEDIRECYMETWKHSSKEAHRLLDYILGSGNTIPLKPLYVGDLTPKSSDEMVLSVINVLSPISDVLEMIMKNIHVLRKHMESIQSQQFADEIKEHLYMPLSDLKVMKLNHPLTVCINEKCMICYAVLGTKCFHYVQRCCEPCFMKNPTCLISKRALSECRETDHSKICKQCGCDPLKHIHAYYLTKTEAKRIDIFANPNMENTKEKFVEIINERILQFKCELDMLIKYLAGNIYILRTSLKLSFDPFEEHVKYLIERENCFCGESNNLEDPISYTHLLECYSNEITNIIESSGSPTLLEKSSESFLKYSDLYNLPLTGEKLRELVESQTIARAKEYEELSNPVNNSSQINNTKFRNNQNDFERKLSISKASVMRSINSQASGPNGHGNSLKTEKDCLQMGNSNFKHYQNCENTQNTCLRDNYNAQHHPQHEKECGSLHHCMHDCHSTVSHDQKPFHSEQSLQRGLNQVPYIKCGNPYCRSPQCIGFMNPYDYIPSQMSQIPSPSQIYEGDIFGNDNENNSNSEYEDAEEGTDETEMSKKDIEFFEKFKLLRGLKVDEEKEINILLLGGTGIGKSTFINALANYLSYKSLKNAEQEKLMVLIPTQFHIQDKDLNDHFVKVGSDDNECLEVGSSATQGVKTYVFPIGSGKTKLRIIDSPGVGDTRGPAQDRINCENILSYLSQLEKLHAICCLFSTTNARITVAFDYCFKEILSRLDKSASNNLVFIFTNARAAHFTPGETLPILRKLADNIKKNPPYVKIPLDHRNIFCFENDCFKYLAAIKQNIEFTEDIREFFNESWRNSSMECWRMIAYIIGDSSHEPLVAHDIRNTISVNEARRLIINLSMPLADISQNIHDNIMVLDRHKQYLQTHNLSIEDMKQMLYVPIVNLEVTELKQPVTVCAGNKCTEVYTIKDVKKWHYKQRCHDPCYLQNVPKEIIGSPELIGCAAMDRSTGKCIKCGCDFSAHMHIYYISQTVEDKIEDESVKNNLLTNEQAVEKTKQVIKDIEKRKNEFEKERKKITEYTARFAHFLQNNAIAPYNDAFENYIKYMIEREKTLGKNADQRVIKQMQDLLNEYKEIKKSYETALSYKDQMGNISTLESVTSESIMQSVNELYRLPHTGKKIKDMVESQKTARSGEYDKTNEYIHPSPNNMFVDLNDEDDTSKPKKTKKKQNKKKVPNKDSSFLGRTYARVLNFMGTRSAPNQYRDDQNRYYTHNHNIGTRPAPNQYRGDPNHHHTYNLNIRTRPALNQYQDDQNRYYY